MLKKIYKIASSGFLSIVLLSSILFIAPISASAKESFKLDQSFAAISTDNEKASQSLETSEQENNFMSQKDELEITSDGKSRYPDLGDDQVFPFVAGLDSYEGS